MIIHTALSTQGSQEGSADDNWHCPATQEATRMWLNDETLESTWMRSSHIAGMTWLRDNCELPNMSASSP